ncbi:cell envelope integrity protein TolA [Vibrio neptunius]|uniref:Cell envelope integrity protein TolA n=1 Tax=Vibrio neptunius TaxID=170651 RepID=A0ABS2ZWW9_9VIBR|nr:cell envelope integrity protein TolA [Vibrio neptunius]MBN3492150.1 cell envelope integrity protein TolA [Vibrio neptunius]MBN3514647.1 cell envelope integrity protein TolA [Vibrio neptunius]MBN3549227.1 cell envelope integrity protein TolA [Vibrio neptunius]MBN3576752.1 cell envelope integrity protein TolA [Vibrio neptunius]MCH9870416.1 cell envelope integrity protein TolA [Vibrio neptunius]
MKETKPKKKSDYTKPIAISAALHALLAVALIWGTDFTMSKPEPSGQMVQAVVIDPNLVRQQAQKIRSQREEAAKKEQDRLDKLRRESEQLEKNRKAEEERIRQLKEQQAREAKAAREAEKARQQKEKERQAAEEQAQKERERAAKLEAERKAKEAAIAKAEQERVAREKAAKEAEEKARRQREAAEKAEKQRIAKEKAAKEAAEKARKEKERLERLKRERKEQEAALDNIFSGLETEAAQNSSARQQHVTSEAERYGAIYTQLIQQNLLLEDSFRGKLCRVNLRLIPTGAGAIVGDLSVLDGDSRLCSATKRAVAQVGSFPLPQEKDVINRLKNINLTVEPKS